MRPDSKEDLQQHLQQLNTGYLVVAKDSIEALCRDSQLLAALSPDATEIYAAIKVELAKR
jgi:hypothetical protein